MGAQGHATLAKYGKEFYRQIGRKGGLTAAKNQTREHFVAIGRKGGKVTRDRYGLDFYTRIGAIGGSKRKGQRKILAQD